MVLGTMGTILTMGAISHIANKHSKKAYPNFNKKIEKEMDAEFARYGIRGKNGELTEEDIRKIAARCNVPTNKNGILPEKGWLKCQNYVAQYLNNEEDWDYFKTSWEYAIGQQLEEHSKQLQHPSNKIIQEYQYNNKYFNDTNSKNCSWKAQTIVLELKHWYGIPKEEQLRRMKQLQNDTFWGLFCVEPPILRDNPHISNTYTEVWILYASKEHQQGTKYTENVFKNWYTQCCAKLGYDAML